MRKTLLCFVLFSLLVLLSGCKAEETSSQDAKKMSDSMQGKGYGEMPAETRRQMDEAMRKNRGGAPTAPKPKTP